MRVRSSNKMIGKSCQVCRMGTCRCANAQDSRGKRKERRLAKRREKQELLRAFLKREEWDD